MKKFWSQWTPLGSLGTGSQADIGLGPWRFQILVIWGPIDPPEMVAFQSHAKKLNLASSLVWHYQLTTIHIKIPANSNVSGMLSIYSYLVMTEPILHEIEMCFHFIH